MSSEAVSPMVSALVSELFSDAAPRRAWSVLGWGVALGAHVLAGGLALAEQRPLPPAPPPLEVELAAPEPPPPPPVPVAAPVPPDAPRPTERVPSPKAAAAPPEPARAGALLTAKADPVATPAADEPVDFTNDPSLLGFGSGVVAIGGKARVGTANARLSAVPSTGAGVALRPAGEMLTPASDLSRKPGLGESDPCRGYFPSSATEDVATAAVMVTIGRSGAVSNVRLLSESPPKQGFGAAARSCMAGKRFSPGLDGNGNPTATAIVVNVRFMR
jgi:periplasmic protein TonB